MEVRITDTIKERGPAARETIMAAFPGLRDQFTDCIGFTPTGTPLWEEGADWDLEDGSQIRLAVGESALHFEFRSKLIADNERYERLHGVSLDDEDWER